MKQFTRGFTLIEILVALLLLLVGVLGLARLQGAVFAYQREGRLHEQAALAAQSCQERAQSYIQQQIASNSKYVINAAAIAAASNSIASSCNAYLTTYAPDGTAQPCGASGSFSCIALTNPSSATLATTVSWQDMMGRNTSISITSDLNYF